MTAETALLISLVSVGAGFLGALLGLGGGVILIPGLTLLFHVDMKIAIAASLVAVIATSSSAATVYVKEHFTNIRLGMTLELTTTLGAMTGAVMARFISPKYLYILFAILLVYAGYSMIRGRRVDPEPEEADMDQSSLNSSYFDPATGKTTNYTVRHLPMGLLGAGGAGIISGLLGVGGGIIKVPLMTTKMRVPLKVAIATSNFMIGVTAATSAVVYWATGKVDPVVTAPAVIGVLVGARLGTKAAGKLHTKVLRRIFVLFVLFTAVQMLMKGLTVK